MYKTEHKETTTIINAPSIHDAEESMLEAARVRESVSKMQSESINPAFNPQQQRGNSQFNSQVQYSPTRNNWKATPHTQQQQQQQQSQQHTQRPTQSQRQSQPRQQQQQAWQQAPPQQFHQPVSSNNRNDILEELKLTNCKIDAVSHGIQSLTETMKSQSNLSHNNTLNQSSGSGINSSAHQPNKYGSNNNTYGNNTHVNTSHSASRELKGSYTSPVVYPSDNNQHYAPAMQHQNAPSTTSQFSKFNDNQDEVLHQGEAAQDYKRTFVKTGDLGFESYEDNLKGSKFYAVQRGNNPWQQVSEIPAEIQGLLKMNDEMKKSIASQDKQLEKNSQFGADNSRNNMQTSSYQNDRSINNSRYAVHS